MGSLSDTFAHNPLRIKMVVVVVVGIRAFGSVLT